MSLYRWTSAELRRIIRGIIGLSGQNQIGDEDLMRHMNRYWMIVFPSEIKVWEQENVKTLLVSQGQEEVEIPPDMLEPSGACFSDGTILRWFVSFSQFNLVYPPQFTEKEVGKGDGVTTLFTFSLDPESVISGTLIVYYGNTSIGSGNYDNGSLYFNAITGSGTVSFFTPPQIDEPIKAKFGVMKFARPDGVLYTENKLTLRPVPNKDYELTFTGRKAPEELTEGPLAIRPEWGYLIAYGTALEIFAETGNNDGYAQYYNQFKRYEAVALSRTTEILRTARPVPSF
ncbi:MAG: hypothetical protein RR927_04950 [Victivallaceae bacterium]